jgi:hypothetical protein
MHPDFATIRPTDAHTDTAMDVKPGIARAFDDLAAHIGSLSDIAQKLTGKIGGALRDEQDKPSPAPGRAVDPSDSPLATRLSELAFEVDQIRLRLVDTSNRVDL